MIRILVVGEGPADVGSDRGLGAFGEQAEGRIGAVRVLVERLLASTLGRNPPPMEFQGERLSAIGRRHVASGYEGKVVAAITEATSRRCTALAIVIDRDGTDGNRRWSLLEKGRAEARARGLALADKAAIGVAIETVEAWLLADVLALNEALALDPPAGQTETPEGLDGAASSPRHPKTVLRDLIARSPVKGTSPLEAIARRARLEVLGDRCPKGFAGFARDVRAMCR